MSAILFAAMLQESLPHPDNKRKRLRATEYAKVIVLRPKSIPTPTIPIVIPAAIHGTKVFGPVDDDYRPAMGPRRILRDDISRPYTVFAEALVDIVFA